MKLKNLSKKRRKKLNRKHLKMMVSLLKKVELRRKIVKFKNRQSPYITKLHPEVVEDQQEEEVGPLYYHRERLRHKQDNQTVIRCPRKK